MSDDDSELSEEEITKLNSDRLFGLALMALFTNKNKFEIADDKIKIKGDKIK